MQMAGASPAIATRINWSFVSPPSWPGLSPPSTSFLLRFSEDVDARPKLSPPPAKGRTRLAGHDEETLILIALAHLADVVLRVELNAELVDEIDLRLEEVDVVL